MVWTGLGVGVDPGTTTATLFLSIEAVVVLVIDLIVAGLEFPNCF